jgi:hypothetical protein
MLPVVFLPPARPDVRLRQLQSPVDKLNLLVLLVEGWACVVHGECEECHGADLSVRERFGVDDAIVRRTHDGGRNFVLPPILWLGGGGARGGCGNDLIGRDGWGLGGAARTVFISEPDDLGISEPSQLAVGSKNFGH